MHIMTAKMTNFLTFSRQKLSDLLYCALCIFLIILVSACGDAYYSYSKTGSIAFSVEWKGAPTMQPTSRAIKAASLDCEAAGVTTVRFDLYDENNSYLVGDSWPCSYHEGTVHGVPVGSNRKLVVSGEDSNGNVLYRGEVTGITVIAGQTTNAGTIVVEAVGDSDDSDETTPPSEIDYGDTPESGSGTPSDPCLLSGGITAFAAKTLRFNDNYRISDLSSDTQYYKFYASSGNFYEISFSATSHIYFDVFEGIGNSIYYSYQYGDNLSATISDYEGYVYISFEGGYTERTVDFIVVAP